MADNEIILKVSLDGAEKETNKLVKLQTEIDKLAAQKKALNQTEKDLAKAVKEGNITRTQYTQQLKEVKAQKDENNAAIKANKAVYRENERQLINNTKAQQLNKGSLVQLRAALARDTFEYDRLTKASRQNSKEGIALKKSIDNQVKSLKQLEKEEIAKNVSKKRAFTKEEKRHLLLSQDCKCASCRKKLDINKTNTFEGDHIIGFKDGGETL